MQKSLILAGVLLVCHFACAQNAQPHLEPGQTADQKPPVISFSCNFPQLTPPFYNIAIESSGRAEYKSTPKPRNEGDPYELKFLASETTRARLFELARQLNYFQGNYEYGKGKVAFTGDKTLTYRNGAGEHSTTYNWSDNLLVQEITTLFQNMEETIELGHQLEDKYRFDKLGVDAVLKTMESEAKDNRLGEIQAIQPILNRVAKDPNLMNISRRRAEFLLSKIPKEAAVTAPGGHQ